jgi:hypothetical protein
MKKISSFLISSLLITSFAIAQNSSKDFPDAEFSNEVYFYQKDSSDKLIRLEKNSSKMDSKMKMGGFGGAESGYFIDGETSPVKVYTRSGLSFIFSNGGTEKKSSPYMDSMMKANGVDPSAMQAMGFGGGDPSNSITLYKTTAEKGQRKIFLQKSGGMFGSKKPKSSDKYSFSLKKIREGYWQLVIDKPLPAGEYAFTLMGVGMGSMDGGVSIYAFAIK